MLLHKRPDDQPVYELVNHLIQHAKTCDIQLGSLQKCVGQQVCTDCQQDSRHDHILKSVQPRSVQQQIKMLVQSQRCCRRLSSGKVVAVQKQGDSTSEWALYIPHRNLKRPLSCCMAWVGTVSVASSTAAAKALASCSMYRKSRLNACIRSGH